MKISDLSLELRPRERLVLHGAASLDDASLLAILLRTGMQGKNVLDVAASLLEEVNGSLCALEKMSLPDICRVDGIGRDKALTVKAAMELSRRMAREQTSSLSLSIDSPEEAIGYLATLFSDTEREECWIVLLKRSRKVICPVRISTGGISSTDIDTSGIVKKALDMNARNVILAHNHPSGSPEPSQADIRLTERLRDALSTFSIHLVDHIILSDRGCYSFSEGLIPDCRL